LNKRYRPHTETEIPKNIKSFFVVFPNIIGEGNEKGDHEDEVEDPGIEVEVEVEVEDEGEDDEDPGDDGFLAVDLGEDL
jgi:hypothetical protein